MTSDVGEVPEGLLEQVQAVDEGEIDTEPIEQRGDVGTGEEAVAAFTEHPRIRRQLDLQAERRVDADRQRLREGKRQCSPLVNADLEIGPGAQQPGQLAP